ncbi:hypothetical protein ACFZAG_31655 [Streptomyces sp. NPDC012403]
MVPTREPGECGAFFPAVLSHRSKRFEAETTSVSTTWSERDRPARPDMA